MSNNDNLPDFNLKDQDVKDPRVAIATGASDNVPIGVTQKITRISSILTVLVSGLALFSDGFVFLASNQAVR